MKDLTSGAARLERIVDSDANAALNRTLRVAESDLAMILGAYMAVRSLDMRASKSADGYRLEITVEAARFYDVGNTSDV
ncbi:MAG: hypothetical protein OSJ83_06035 [Clostridia bacterium]|nr:hypothetical protein [Clostridia bacterium]